MTDVEYRIVKHDGGWAYRQGDSTSEVVPTREQAVVAAVVAADEMAAQDVAANVLIENDDGEWVDVPDEVYDFVRKALESGVPTNPVP